MRLSQGKPRIKSNPVRSSVGGLDIVGVVEGFVDVVGFAVGDAVVACSLGEELGTQGVGLRSASETVSSSPKSEIEKNLDPAHASRFSCDISSPTPTGMTSIPALRASLAKSKAHSAAASLKKVPSPDSSKSLSGHGPPSLSSKKTVGSPSVSKTMSFLASGSPAFKISVQEAKPPPVKVLKQEIIC